MAQQVGVPEIMWVSSDYSLALIFEAFLTEFLLCCR